jgi:hypothetical protein
MARGGAAAPAAASGTASSQPARLRASSAASALYLQRPGAAAGLHSARRRRTRPGGRAGGRAGGRSPGNAARRAHQDPACEAGREESGGGGVAAINLLPVVAASWADKELGPLNGVTYRLSAAVVRRISPPSPTIPRHPAASVTCRTVGRRRQSRRCVAPRDAADTPRLRQGPRTIYVFCTEVGVGGWSVGR